MDILYTPLLVAFPTQTPGKGLSLLCSLLTAVPLGPRLQPPPPSSTNPSDPMPIKRRDRGGGWEQKAWTQMLPLCGQGYPTVPLWTSVFSFCSITYRAGALCQALETQMKTSALGELTFWWRLILCSKQGKLPACHMLAKLWRNHRGESEVLEWEMWEFSSECQRGPH